MPSSTATPVRPLSVAVLAFCEQHHLRAHLETALQLVEQHFAPVRIDVATEPDPETDEESVIIDVRVDLTPDDAVTRKRAYTRHWVQAAPVEAIGRIRLVLDLGR